MKRNQNLKNKKFEEKNNKHICIKTLLVKKIYADSIKLL